VKEKEEDAERLRLDWEDLVSPGHGELALSNLHPIESENTVLTLHHKLITPR
jgi:hypothetical protein